MLASVLTELHHDLRAQRTRTLLSLLGIAWGAMALVLLLAFSFGFERLFQERSAGIGDAIAIAWPQRTTRPWRGFPAGRILRVHREDVRALAAAVPGLEAASAEFTATERIRIGGALHRIALSGVDPEFATLRNLTAAPGGRFPSERDSADAARVVFLGDLLARQLFGTADPIGRLVVLRGRPFQVVGVLQPKQQDSDYGGRDESRAFVPATTFLQVFGTRPVADFVFRAAAPDRQADCTRAVVQALAARLQFDPQDEEVLSVWDTTEQRRALGAIFLAFHVILAIGGGFTLLVGGLGVAQLMLLAVRRRTTEIGLKLAIGATPARLRAEWLLQALVLVVAGSAGGLLLAAAAIFAVRSSPLSAAAGSPFVPLPVAVAAAALLGLVAFVAGYAPARAAAGLDPTAALRGGR